MNRFIKNNLKVFLAVIITLIISISGTVYAVNKYYAKDIGFTPSKENQDEGFTATNVEDALNKLYDLYLIKNDKIKDGEAFLLSCMGEGKKMTTNSGYSATQIMSNLDFSNIKSFKYQYDLDTTNSDYQWFKLYDSKKNYYLNVSLTGSGIVELNGAINVNLHWVVSNHATGTFKIISYKTLDGIEHK